MIQSRLVNVSKQESFDIILIGITMAALVALVAAFVISRDGNLAWDDSEYLSIGLETAHATELNGRLKGIWKPLRAIWYTIYIGPKPPLLHAWIAQSWLLFGDRSIMPVLVFSTVVPFGLLALGVVTVAWRLFGSRAALLSLVCLGASPGMLSIGSSVLVETFMSLWILLLFYSMAVLIDRPSSASALLLGTALAMALLTKLTIVLLLPGAALYSLYGYLRRHPIDAAFARAIACVVLPVFVLAGPWYLRNGRGAVNFALWSARFNAFTGGAITPRGQRLIQIAESVCGWPLFLVVIAVGLWSYFPRRGSMMLPDGAGRSFIKVTTSGFALGAAILLLPSYFETRFLLPAWPAMAIVVGALLQGFISESRPWRSAVTASVLAIGLGWSIASLYGQPRWVTYWSLDGVIQKLVTEHDVRTLGVLGETCDWNIFKVRLISELRNAEARHSRVEIVDLSRGSPDDVEHELDRIDALAMLERSQISDQWLREAPRINRGYAIIDEALRKRADQFMEVGADSNVPPRFRVYVRRRVSEPSLRAELYPHLIIDRSTHSN